MRCAFATHASRVLAAHRVHRAVSVVSVVSALAVCAVAASRAPAQGADDATATTASTTAPATTAAPATPIDPQLAEVIEVLRVGLVPAPDGRHHANLMSLRMLADPSLRPLFEALRTSPDWTTRVDALLGLAESSESRSIDAADVASLTESSDRAAAVNSAISLDLINTETARILLNLPDVPSMERMVLLAVSREPNHPVDDAEFVRGRAGGQSFSEDGLASLLLAASGEPMAWAAFAERLTPLPTEQREAIVAEIAQAIVAYRLPEAAPLLAALAWQLELPLASERTVVATRLALKDPGAIDGWRSLERRSTSRRDHVKNALTLLAEGPDAGALLIEDQFEADDELTKALHAALLQRPSVGERIPHVVQAVASGHVPTAQAAAIFADRLSGTAATPVWTAIVQAAQGAQSSAALRNVSVQAAAALAKSDPEALVALATGAPESFRESCLFAMLRADSAEAARAAQTLRAGLGRKGQALAVIALAAQDLPLSDDDAGALIRAASGGADLDPVLQIQAAWLVAKRAGITDLVIRTITAATPAPPAPTATQP